MLAITRFARRAAPAAALSIVAAVSARAVSTGQPTDTGRSIWSGVYTVEQARRGEAAYDRHCSVCHGSGLEGVDGPALMGGSFTRTWSGLGVDSLFVKVHDRMPADAPGTLSPAVSVDIVGFLLESNGFPPGREELSPSLSTLAQIEITDRQGGREVPNFALVQVIGCLSRPSEGTWALTRATEPVRARGTPGGRAGGDVPTELGSETFRLIDAHIADAPRYEGHTVAVTGLLMRRPTETAINTTAIDSLRDRCDP